MGGWSDTTKQEYLISQHQADRRWLPFRVDLSDYGGQSVVLILETGSSPAGDDRYDWASCGTPRLLVP
jgi:hypothetical protein